ncbi:MAG: PKD domain-containing protein [Verrucomicrobiota bacterium]
MQIHSDYSQVAPGYVVSFVARDIGRLTGLVWDFGDGTLVTNRAFLSHAWETPGIYAVHLTGYNEELPGRGDKHGFGRGHCCGPLREPGQSERGVSLHQLGDGGDEYPGCRCLAGNLVGRLVLVTNGVDRTGSTGTYGENRVTLPNAVVLRSVNGPSVTLIEGAL